MQSIHYLTLCLLIPPLLTIFAEPTALAYEGKLCVDVVVQVFLRAFQVERLLLVS